MKKLPKKTLNSEHYRARACAMGFLSIFGVIISIIESNGKMFLFSVVLTLFYIFDRKVIYFIKGSLPFRKTTAIFFLINLLMLVAKYKIDIDMYDVLMAMAFVSFVYSIIMNRFFVQIE